MPRSCTVCTHPDRTEIDEALVGGVSSAEIAGRYRTIGERAIRRHRTNHLPETLAKAEEAGELRTALGAIREARGNLELLARLLGELDERPTVNLSISPEWLELRAVIVTALEPHPEALRAVVGALESGGNGMA